MTLKLGYLTCIGLGMLCATATRSQDNADALPLDFLRYLVEFHQTDQWIDPEVLIALDALPALARQGSSTQSSTLSPLQSSQQQSQQPPETAAEVTP